jgi:PAS domain S-box-containing protein
MRILVIEDSPTQSNMIRMNLERRGQSVQCAASLGQAMDILKDPGIDAALLDLSLPDSTGIDTFYRLRDCAKDVPIVVFTGMADQKLAVEAVKNGAQDYLIKGVADGDSVLRCLQYSIERNRVELALRKSEKRLRIILENSYDAFISMDPKWKITDWNVQAEKTFGFTREEIIGRNLSSIVPHHLRKQYAREVDEFFAKEKFGFVRMTNEMIAIHKDGHEFPMEIGIFRISEEEGDSYCAFVRDITERKQLHEELENRVQERTAELSHSNEELRQFAKIASHDLQEPLRAVEGFANLLSESAKGKLDNESQEFLEYILDGTKRMQGLIQAVMSHSSIRREEGGDQAVSDCNFVIEEVLANLSVSIKETGARFEVDNLPEVAIERGQLVQLFQNLISNSLKYRGPEEPRIFISAERSVDQWLFSVRDNGIGIDPKYSNKIFDMFARLHGKTQYSGTGMGLAICKKIVKSHGGNIWVESEVGHGSIFLFTLPAVVKDSDNGQSN